MFSNSHVVPIQTNRNSCFSAFTEASTNAHLQVHSPDDSFIELMAMGHVVMWNDSHHLQAASLEGLVSEVIEVTK